MREMKWTRFGIASVASTVALAAAGMGAVAVGCSNTDDTTPAVLPDGSTGDSSSIPPGPDGGATPDAADAAPPLPPPSITIIHAAPGLPRAVRLCLGANLGGTVLFPPNIPVRPTAQEAPNGLYFGSGAALKVDPSVAGLLPTAALVPVILPGSVDPSRACSDIVANPPAGTVTLNTIPKGTFENGKSYFVVVVGCPVGADGGTYACGEGYDPNAPVVDGGPNGTASAQVVTVDNTTVIPGNSIGAQFLHLSPETNSLVSALNVRTGGSPNVLPALTYTVAASDGGVADAGDASTPAPGTLKVVPIGTATEYVASPLSIVPATAVSSPETWANLASAAFNLYTVDPDGGAPAVSLFLSVGLPNGLPLSTIMQETTGAADAATPYFQGGQAYTFIAVGNPETQTPPAPGNDTLRIIALPNNPFPAGADAGQ